MYYIRSFEIYGFWGSKNIHLKMHADLNFVIGPNGSGKTTVINLLAAALRADFPVLYSVQFDRIVIIMQAKNGSIKPRIEIKKSVDDDTGYFKLEFTVKEKFSDKKGIRYVVKGPFDEKIYRDPRHLRNRRLREEGAHLSKILKDMVEVNWLSIHRTNLESMHIESMRRHVREESFDSLIDQKLKQISNSFSNYFSLLSSLAEIESKNFQEHVFLSLLDSDHNVIEVIHQLEQESADKSTLVNVLKELGIPNKNATKSVDPHLARLSAAKQRMENNHVFEIKDAITLSDARRVTEMVERWRILQSKRAEIFKPRTLFEEIINSHFTGKNLRFDDRNVPQVQLNSGDEVDIGVLSSGEKQLFILLGEALLQEQRLVVFISDEPELSLHVNWQSSLFQNVRKLNNSCQIISATHSPDIVSEFRDRVIKIEECFLNV